MSNYDYAKKETKKELETFKVKHECWKIMNSNELGCWAAYGNRNENVLTK